MGQQQRLRRDLDRLLRHLFCGVRDIAYKAEPMAGPDHLGAEFCKPVMRDGAGLEITDVVRGVMDELQVPQTALVRFLQPLELAIEKIEPFHVSNNRRLLVFVRFLQIGCAKGAAHPMMRNQLVHPGEPVEMIAVKFVRCRGAHHSECTFGTAAEHWEIRDVGKTGDRQRSRAHRIRQVVARRRFRRDPGLSAMRVHVD
jgi:hypothetical protein